MQKHIKYAIYVKNTKICKNMHNHTIYGLLHNMRYMRRSGSTRKNRTGWCAYFQCFCIYLRYMQKNEEVCIYIKGVSIFCVFSHIVKSHTRRAKATQCQQKKANLLPCCKIDSIIISYFFRKCLNLFSCDFLSHLT